MLNVRPLSSLHKDYVIRNLRTELGNFQTLLETMENSDRCDVTYVEESLKALEIKLRSVGRFVGTC